MFILYHDQDSEMAPFLDDLTVCVYYSLLPECFLSYMNVFNYYHVFNCDTCYFDLKNDYNYVNIIDNIIQECENELNTDPNYDSIDEMSTSNDSVVNDDAQKTCFESTRIYKSKHKNNLIFAHLNLNSLKKKHDEICMLVENNIDIMFLSETKLDHTYTSSMFSIDKYCIVRQDRTAHGGGLLIYIRSDIANRRRLDLEYNQHDIECICLEIVIRSVKYLYVLLYRPPRVHDCHLLNALENIHNASANLFSQIIVIGDLNCNVLLERNILADFLDIYDYNNLVTEATCFKGTPSLLDVILSNKKRKIIDIKCIKNSISDFHSIVIASTRCHIPDMNPRIIHYRSLKHFDNAAFIADLNALPMSVCDIFDDIDDSLWFHNKLLMSVIDKHAPQKSKTLKRPQLPYMNSDLRKNINIKEMLRRKSLKCSCRKQPCDHKLAYNKKRNEVKKLKGISINNYLKEKCENSSGNPRAMWSTIRPMVSDKGGFSSQKIILSHEGKIVNSDESVCEIFNNFYVTVTDSIGNELPITDSENICEIISSHSDHSSIGHIRNKVGHFLAENVFEFKPITSADIHKKLVALKTRKATGCDNISAGFLKLGASVLCHTLLPILNKCLTCSVYPDSLKLANVSPIFKSGDSLDVSKYRPVSILPTLSKVFEGAILDQAATYAYENVLSKHLCAFRSKYGCEDILLKFVEETKQALDKGDYCIAMATDLSKAFDCLPHRLLLAKANAYGFSPSACKLFMSYLTNRCQRVKINDNMSSWQYLKRGIPQGSLCGPFMYNMFVNDFLFSLPPSCTVYNYADDNTLVVSGSDLDKTKGDLETACNKAMCWFKENEMKANPTKFQCIVFSKKSLSENDKKFKLENDEISCQANIKLLGVYIDEKLTFDYHVREMCKKAGKLASALYRLKNKVSQKTKMQLYHAFVVSNLCYCSLVWHFCGARNTKLIEKIHERGLRFVLDDYTLEYSELLSLLERPKMYIDRIRKILVLAFKTVHQIGPSFLYEHIEIQSTPYDLRGGCMLVLPKFNTVKYGKHSITYEMCTLWNKLSCDIKNCDNVHEFKKCCDTLQYTGSFNDLLC